MKASQFDKAFDDGKSVAGTLNLKSARRPGRDGQGPGECRLSLLDGAISSTGKRTASGVTRQSLIKIWLAEKLQHP